MVGAAVGAQASMEKHALCEPGTTSTAKLFYCGVIK